MMYSLLEKILELNFSGLKRKQRSITRLFPTFPDRVKDVGGRGGVRLADQALGLWHLKVHSGTKAKVWYDIHVKFKNLDDLLEILVKNRKLWKTDRSGVDLRKLAHEFIYKVDLQLKCSCPAYQYWGPAYILSLSKYDAKYTDPETRPPRIRNPKQYGAYCKHLEAVMKVLPFYENTMAKYLGDYYGKTIGVYEEAAKREFGWIKKVVKKLAKRKKEVEEPEKEVEPKKELEPEKEIEPEEEAPEKEIPKKRKPRKVFKKKEPEEEPEEEEPEEIEPEEEEPEEEPKKKKPKRGKSEPSTFAPESREKIR